MSQLGMQLPGSSRARSSGMNVYTALLVVATLALGAAAAMVWVNGAKLAPGGQPWQVQGDRVELPG